MKPGMLCLQNLQKWWWRWTGWTSLGQWRWFNYDWKFCYVGEEGFVNRKEGVEAEEFRKEILRVFSLLFVVLIALKFDFDSFQLRFLLWLMRSIQFFVFTWLQLMRCVALFHRFCFWMQLAFTCILVLGCRLHLVYFRCCHLLLTCIAFHVYLLHLRFTFILCLYFFPFFIWLAWTWVIRSGHWNWVYEYWYKNWLFGFNWLMDNWTNIWIIGCG